MKICAQVSARQVPRMKAGVDFHLAFSPEREDPGNDKSKVKTDAKSGWWLHAGLP